AGEPGKALEWFDRCLADGEPLARQTPPAPGVQGRLRNAWWGKAEALTALDRYPDALAAWDQAVALADGDQQVCLKLYPGAALDRDPDFDALRGRADFKKLLADLSAAPPSAAGPD